MFRSYVENIDLDSIILDSEEAHHLIHVLRGAVGDQVELFNGSGDSASATIKKLTKRIVELQIETRQKREPRTSGRVIVAASVAKGDRFDWLITKCTELGVDVIVPVLFERTVKLAAGTNTQSRFKNLAIAACKQCGRNFLPTSTTPLPFAEAITEIQRNWPEAKLMFGSTAADARPVLNCINGKTDHAAFVGPEGGMTAAEEILLSSHGASGVKLTSTILRIETAAVAFGAILCSSRDGI
jgi:16S rRNA (uracil1498-N3)-methyltransferase